MTISGIGNFNFPVSVTSTNSVSGSSDLQQIDIRLSAPAQIAANSSIAGTLTISLPVSSEILLAAQLFGNSDDGSNQPLNLQIIGAYDDQTGLTKAIQAIAQLMLLV
jgi:hypothetical protein